jgi:3-oxoacyl-[acyl-carrier protein] reductase
MSKLKGKVAVVTGASKGIGAGIAKALAAEGAVNYASSRAGADKVVADIEKAGGKAVAIQGDMSKSDDVVRLFAETKQALGTPNVLVNNAGVFQFDPLENVNPDEFHRQFNINVLGPILAAREAAVYFGSQGGSIINVSSIVSTRAFPQSVIYSATKGALDSVTRVLAAELGPKNIRVNTLAPGMIETDFETHAKASTPLGRIGQPDDIAKIAVFLASDESGWVSGERIEGAGGHP